MNFLHGKFRIYCRKTIELKYFSTPIYSRQNGHPQAQNDYFRNQDEKTKSKHN